MATIRKRGNKFQAQVRRNGFQGVSKSFERLTEAKAWARHIEIGFDRGETPLSEKQKANTFANIAKRYLKEVSPSKKSSISYRPLLSMLMLSGWIDLSRTQLVKWQSQEIANQEI